MTAAADKLQSSFFFFPFGGKRALVLFQKQAKADQGRVLAAVLSDNRLR